MAKQPARGAQRATTDQEMATAETLSIDFGPSDGAPRARRKRRRAGSHAHPAAGQACQVTGCQSYTTLSGDEKMTLNFVSADGSSANVEMTSAEDDSTIELIYPQPPKLQASTGWQHVTESLTSDGRRQQQILPAEEKAGWTYSAPSDSDLSDAPPPDGEPISEDLCHPPVSGDAPTFPTVGSQLPVGTSSQLEFGQPLPADGDGDIGEQCEQNTYDTQSTSGGKVFSVLVTGNAIFGGHSQWDRKAAEEPTLQTGLSPQRRVIDTVQQQLLAERPELLSHEERRRLLTGDSLQQSESPVQPDHYQQREPFRQCQPSLQPAPSASSIIDLRDSSSHEAQKLEEVAAGDVDKVEVVKVPIMQPAAPVVRDPEDDTDLDRGYVFPRKRLRSRRPADKEAVRQGASTLLDSVSKPASPSLESGSRFEAMLEKSANTSVATSLNDSCGSTLASESTMPDVIVDDSSDVDEEAGSQSFVATSCLDEERREVDPTDEKLLEPNISLVPRESTVKTVLDLRKPSAQKVPVDLSAVAPLQTPPQELLDRVLDQSAKLAKYPALSSPTTNLALRFRVRPDQVLLTDTLDQSREVVIRLFEYFDCRRVLVAGPYLQVWEDQFRKTGYDVARLDEQEIARPGRSETTTKQRIVEQADPTVVVVSNPNRFTGQPYSTESLIDLAARYQLLVIDETLMPLAGTRHCDSRLVRLPNVVVIRNIARPWHTPGLEGTCYVGPADLLNHPTVQSAAPECSDLMAAACDVYTSSDARTAQRETVADLETLTQDLHFRLTALAATTAGLSVEALGTMPFVLVSLKDGYGHWQSLREQGWIVRTCEDVAHLGRDWARICVHSEQVHTDFVSSLEAQIQRTPEVAKLA